MICGRERVDLSLPCFRASRKGSTPFSRTVELRVVPPVAACPVSAAVADIMTGFNVVKDIGSGLSPRLVILPIDAFAFEHSEEALGHGIIGATAHRAHAADDLMRLQKSLVFLVGKLTAAIRVQNDRRAG